MLQTQLRSIEQVLEKIWLHPSDIKIFLLWLELWASTIAQLAQHANMGRITVHEIVRRLIKYGLFLQTYSQKKRLVYPNTLDSLNQFIEKRKLEVHQLEKEVHAASHILRSLQTQAENFPKTRFYKWREWIHIMMQEMLHDRKSIMVTSDWQHFYDLVDNEFLEQSLALRNKYRISVQLLFPMGFEYFCFTQWMYQQKLGIRFLPENTTLKWWMTIRWNKVAFHCYEWRFLTTTIIESQDIANMMTWNFTQAREQNG